MLSTVTETSAEFEFSVLVRCDTKECGAQARVAAIYPNGASLAFCSHHANKHREAIALTNPKVAFVEHPDSHL